MNIYLIIDESGSMAPLRNDTIQGFNRFLDDQQKLSKVEVAGKRVKPARLHVVKFDTTGIRKPIWDVPIEQVKPWGTADYTPNAGTPLLDAVGDALSEATGKKALVVVITDGEENSSNHWNKGRVKDLIGKRLGEGWTIIYMGANVDAFHEAGSMGINVRSTTGYTATPAGTQAMYASVSDASLRSRSGMSYTMGQTAAGDPLAVADNAADEATLTAFRSAAGIGTPKAKAKAVVKP